MSAFISYSRHDYAFVRRLQQALKDAGEVAWTDWLDIPKAAEWQPTIQHGIETANDFIFVISPDSVASVECLKEIKIAALNRKRIIPVLFRAVRDTDVPSELAKFNRISFASKDNFEASFQDLLIVLHTDLAWTSAHSRLIVRAREWENKSRNSSFLLQGEDLNEAEVWLEQSGSKPTEPTALQTEYIVASRRSAIKTQKRVRDALIIGITLVLLGAAAAVFQTLAAKKQTRMVTSGRLATSALLAKDSQFDLALLLSVEAKDMLDTYDARNAIVTLWQTRSNILRYFHTRVNDPKVLYSPDGKELAICGVNDLEFVDSVTMHTIWSMGGNFGKVLAFSPDGTLLVALLSTEDSDAPTMLQVLRTRDHSLVIASLSNAPVFPERVQFSSDGKLLLASGGTGIQIWTVPDFRPLEYVEPYQFGSNLGRYLAIRLTYTFDPLEPAFLAVVQQNGVFAYLDPVTMELRNPDPVRSALINSLLPRSPRFDQVMLGDRSRPPYEEAQLSFSPRGTKVVVSSKRLGIFVLDLAKRTVHALDLREDTLNKSGIVDEPTIAFSLDDSELAIHGNEIFLGLWNTRDFTEDSSIRGVADRAEPAWSPDGILTLVEANGDMVLWRPHWSRGERILENEDVLSPINQMLFTPDGRTVISESNLNVAAWDIITGARTPQFVPWLEEIGGNFHLESTAFGPDGSTLAAVDANPSEKMRIRRLDVATQRPLPDLTANGPPSAVENCVGTPCDPEAISISNTGLVAAADRSGAEVWLWYPARPGSPIRLPLSGHEAAAFSPDGKLLAVVGLPQSGKNFIHLWNLSRARVERDFDLGNDPSASRLIFSPDSTLLAASTSTEIKFWDVKSGRRLLNSLSFAVGQALNFAFVPNGTQLVVRAKDGSIALWDIEMQRMLGEPMRPFGAWGFATGLAISPNGRVIASTFYQGNLRLWENPLLLDWTAQVCAVTNRNLSRDEWLLYMGTAVHYRKTCPGLPDGAGTPARVSH